MKPLDRDWFPLDWRPIYTRTGLAPHAVPGVQWQERSPMVQVHLTHLRMLGLERPVYDARRTRFNNGWAVNDAQRILEFGLRPHQCDGIDYIRARRGTLLADEMRVGKTATAMYSHDPASGKLFIVGPLAARAVWHEWAARRFGHCEKNFECSICTRAGNDHADPEDYSFWAFDGRAITDEQCQAASAARVVFCHFAIVPTWAQIFDQLRIGTLVIDEVHLPQSGMQSRKSITGNALRMLNAVAGRSVFLSGSPLWSKPKGLWHILDMLNPGAWGDFWTYARRYCDAKPTGYGWKADGASNEEELQTRLREVMLRRTWLDVSGSLPPITRSVEIVALSDAQRDRVEELAARIRSGTGGTQTVVGDLARLRKLYAHEKAHAALIKAREAMSEGRSVIVWTWHREIAAQIAIDTAAGGAGIDANVLHIDGDSPPGEREQIIEHARLIAQSRPVCLVATMGALATAVNLAFAEEEVFAELDWNPDSIAQAEMRCFDGTRPIRVTYLVADCDVDQKLADALLSKFDVKDRLGVTPGVGSVADVLRESIGIEEARTLDALAAAVLSELNDVG